MVLCGERKRDNDDDGFDGCGPKGIVDSGASTLHMNRGWERFES